MDIKKKISGAPSKTKKITKKSVNRAGGFVKKGKEIASNEVTEVFKALDQNNDGKIDIWI